MSSGETRTTQTQTRTPGLGSEAALRNIIAQAQQLTGISPTTEQGLTALEQAGASIDVSPAQQFLGGVLGRGAPQTGIDTLEATARGDLLQANPFIDQIINQTTQDITERINQQAAGAGRLGSGAQQQAIARAVAPAALGLRGQAFEAERSRQLAAAQGLFGGGFQAAGQIPGIAQAGLIGPEAILRAGLLRDQAPFQRLQQQASLINPIAGAFGETTGVNVQETQQSPLQTALGLGITGLGLASGFGGLGLLGGAGGALAGAGSPFRTDAAGRLLGGI